MIEGESTKIVNFMTHAAAVLVLEHGHFVKMQHFFSSSCLHRGLDVRKPIELIFVEKKNYIFRE